jgi:hypothetical protein
MIWCADISYSKIHSVQHTSVDSLKLFNDYKLACKHAVNKVSSFLIKYVNDIDQLYTDLYNNYGTTNIKNIIKINGKINITCNIYSISVFIIKKEVITKKEIVNTKQTNKITSVQLFSIVNIIWKKLDYNSIIKLMRVNKQINTYLNSNTIWNTFMQNYFKINIKHSFINIKQIYQKIYFENKYKIIHEYLDIYLNDIIPDSFLLLVDHTKYLEKINKYLEQKIINKKFITNKILKIIDKNLGINNINDIISYINDVYKTSFIDINVVTDEIKKVHSFLEIIKINEKLLETINSKYGLQWKNIDLFNENIFAKFNVDGYECYIKGDIYDHHIGRSDNTMYFKGTTISFNSDHLGILDLLS